MRLLYIDILLKTVPVQSMMVKGEAPASVQCAALRALGQVLDSIDTVPPRDAKMFNECALVLIVLPSQS